ncbi:hypothetical protein SERLA73DRAFT_175312 [Serpula lacrymans var. lacrymans S7.3]|uniref:Uncharacterized protein n=2 Tax=Serpula lacrymans var. lacrymans TaxID=341189 RepID=F8PIS8_SERL3|nr:uncharacterized protein SERLADRAFT_457517 [Serpula lacrymans var. lacrymans S7.9]EGO03711.1 hypothetical protein SERLA73DRAFT_175312 [Serpula lacrymans var. lacrymans S7.3]EGO29575.1 hypothetical protein SERLADRAFT_457517 [Serpula lacrymans var. lacrymans S7.9]
MHHSVQYYRRIPYRIDITGADSPCSLFGKINPERRVVTEFGISALILIILIGTNILWPVGSLSDSGGLQTQLIPRML